MANSSILALGVLITFGLTQAALADSHGDNGNQADMGTISNMPPGHGDLQMGMMSSQMMPMMQNMMKMHSSVMESHGSMMGMMDRDLMATMMPGGDAGNMPSHMSAKLQEFDADADGALTLEEFKALHMSAVRDRMIDRFQHLDADGDGQVTQQEMDAAATRMGAMRHEPGASDTTKHHGIRGD